MKVFGRNLLSDRELVALKSDVYRSGWIAGQNSGMHLQPEFTQQFFSKIRRNPNTLVFEIPEESYAILKEKLISKQP